MPNRPIAVLALLTASCAWGPLSYEQHGLAPVVHRASRTAIAVGCVGGTQALGLSLGWSLGGCVPGLFVLTKAWTYANHPDRLGPWSFGDALCDLGWQAGAVPVTLAVRGDWRVAVPTAAAWAAWVFAVQRRCVP